MQQYCRQFGSIVKRASREYQNGVLIITQGKIGTNLQIMLTI